MDHNHSRRKHKHKHDHVDDDPDEDSYYYDDQYESDPDFEDDEVTPLPVFDPNSSAYTTDDNVAPSEIVIVPKVIVYKPTAGK